MIISCDDFNLDDQSDHTARDFIDLLNSMDLNQHVTQPTHNGGHTLDLVISHH